MPPEPVVSVGDANDNSENLARYEELTSKAILLYGQHLALLDILKVLDTSVEDLKLTWTGVRANKFYAEWARRHEELNEWAGQIAEASNRLSKEANNYKP